MMGIFIEPFLFKGCGLCRLSQRLIALFKMLSRRWRWVATLDSLESLRCGYSKMLLGREFQEFNLAVNYLPPPTTSWHGRTALLYDGLFVKCLVLPIAWYFCSLIFMWFSKWLQLECSTTFLQGETYWKQILAWVMCWTMMWWKHKRL